MKRRILVVITGCLVSALCVLELRAQSQGQGPGGGTAPVAGRQGGRPGGPPPDPTKPAKLELVEGTTARYKVREQLAGVSFPSDAVGTHAISHGCCRGQSGWVDRCRSIPRFRSTCARSRAINKMRDGYVQSRTLETEKFPTTGLRTEARRWSADSPPCGHASAGGFSAHRRLDATRRHDKK